jgi:hypothetical protein
MFDLTRKLWAESALTSSIEGVLREAAKGNAVEVQKWYFRLKKEAYKQSLKEGISPQVIEARALSKVAPDEAELFIDVVRRLSQPGGVLDEINNWLKQDRPI